jgi:hypothetical protein
VTPSRRPRHHYSFAEYLALCADSNVRLEPGIRIAVDEIYAT